MAKHKPPTEPTPPQENARFEPWTDTDLVPVPEGAMVCNHAEGERKAHEVRIDGVNFEHCATAPDGRWIYAKSV